MKELMLGLGILLAFVIAFGLLFAAFWFMRSPLERQGKVRLRRGRIFVKR